MKIAIVGYGKMGRMIKSIAIGSGHEIAAIIDPVAPEAGYKAVTEDALEGADVAIDFTTPSAAFDNIAAYEKSGIPAVIGTTGWADKLPLLEERKEKLRIIWSGNFSLGVAIFLKLAEYSASLIDKATGYDVSIHEVHHRQKADAPSGTALMAAKCLVDGIERKTRIQIGNPEGRIDENALHLSSERVGYEIGEHTIRIDSSFDTISIEHRARTREGFAEGAVKAAEWILTQENGIYSMDDFIQDFLGGNHE